MNKRLILLILVLPLLLMLSIFTATSSVRLNISVPVSSIEITGNNFIYLNLDDQEKYYVNYAVYPLTAANKKVKAEFERVGDKPFAQLEFVDGYIVPKTIGVAKVYLYTIDGGYKDSFIVQVDSIKVQRIICEVSQDTLAVGKKAVITTTFEPENCLNQMLTYTSNNESVATVDSKGVITAVGKGSAVITVIAEGNAAATYSIPITVYNENILDLAESEVYTYLSSGKINLSLDCDEDYTLTYKVFDLNGTELFDIFDDVNTYFEDVVGAQSQKAFCYKFADDIKKDVVVQITVTPETLSPCTKECIIYKVDAIEAYFDDEEDIVVTAGSLFAIHNKLTIMPQDTEVRYELDLSNNNLSISELSSKIRLSANLVGTTNLTLRVITTSVPSQTITLTKQVVIMPTSLDIVESSNTYGIENIYTIGGYEIDGSDNQEKLTLSYGKTAVGNGAAENTIFETDNAKVQVDSQGLIKILDDDFCGIVNVTAKFSINDSQKTSTPFAIRCVGSGVNVRCFDDLYKATKQNKIVVLLADIKEDFGIDSTGAQVYTESSVEKIATTYDNTHYKNLGKEDEAKIKILISFKADVYGNGYTINAHNVAYGLDKTGALRQDALFKGPLNFVSMSESQSSLVSVKAQDNVCFAVFEDVTLNNIILKNCDLTADQYGNYDLTDLTYVGTTVEVFGDNVNIKYSRLNNGRTVLRAFGDINDSTKAITVNISNCVLSSAREFIVRMGSNCFVDGTTENPSPYIGDSKQSFPAQKSYGSMTQIEKQEYDNNFIKTFVNIKNSVLKDSGLFCIGIDSHFAGDALADGSGFAGGLIESWHDLAKTSYGAKLTFIGDVRMYDWKKITNIDSSTLIEVVGNSSFSDLAFDIREMIDLLATNTENPHLNDIVYRDGKSEYVHGGIAFFGGGKNYGVFESQDYTFKNLNGYEVKLADVGKIQLQLAAGSESFYFMLNDSTTQGFLPKDQDALIASGLAYAPIYIKD